MRILTDENFRGGEGETLTNTLRESGHDVTWVRDPEMHGHPEKGLRGSSDVELGTFATQEGRLVVTKDKSSFVRENIEAGQRLPFGVLVTRLERLSPEARAARTDAFIRERGESLHGHITTLSPGSERMKTVEEQRQVFERTPRPEQQNVASDNSPAQGDVEQTSSLAAQSETRSSSHAETQSTSQAGEAAANTQESTHER